MKNNRDEMVIGILTGLAIGVGVGMLFAPNKGSKTRGKIKHSVVDATQDVSEWLKHAKDDLVQTAHDTKQAFDKKIEGSISQMGNKAEDILSGMEDKLEKLRRQNS